jgi:hypothetical protein
MKRREFIKKMAAATIATAASPYLLKAAPLPQSGVGPHIVFVMFAGGVRQQESVLQRYLTDSQGLTGSAYGGNIMYNMLNGANPTDKIVFGTNPSSGLAGSQPIPQILSQTLQTQGTLFNEVQAAGVGHYSGLVTLLTGSKFVNQGLRQRPAMPTIFEYARKYMDLKATDTWFVGNSIGNSTPLLNHSDHPSFGVQYGANFLSPSVTFGAEGDEHIQFAKTYHPDEELGKVYEMQQFLNNAYNIENTIAEKHDIKLFIRNTFLKKNASAIAHPPINDNNDTRTIGYTCEVLKWFKPRITVVNLNDVDAGHGNFTSYLKNLHRADHAVGHLWNYIQTQIPDMAGNTYLIACPEHGRNLNPNSVLDQNDWLAYDHSDLNSTRIFSMMVGPNVPQNLSVGSAANPIGDISDCVLTMGEILGIKSDIQAEGLVSSDGVSFFDRI